MVSNYVWKKSIPTTMVNKLLTYYNIDYTVGFAEDPTVTLFNLIQIQHEHIKQLEEKVNGLSE